MRCYSKCAVKSKPHAVERVNKCMCRLALLTMVAFRLLLARHDPLCPRYLIEKANVALVPGDAFGAPTCIRISYAASMETLAKALDRLEAALAPANFTRSA